MPGCLPTGPLGKPCPTSSRGGDKMVSHPLRPSPASESSRMPSCLLGQISTTPGLNPHTRVPSIFSICPPLTQATRLLPTSSPCAPAPFPGPGTAWWSASMGGMKRSWVSPVDSLASTESVHPTWAPSLRKGTRPRWPLDGSAQLPRSQRPQGPAEGRKWVSQLQAGFLKPRFLSPSGITPRIL